MITLKSKLYNVQRYGKLGLGSSVIEVFSPLMGLFKVNEPIMAKD